LHTSSITTWWAAAATLVAAASAHAQDHPVILQWFEQPWEHMERRLPDLFMAGYGGVWLPPPSLAAAQDSVGYDVFDRFNLGTPSQPTAYGTEQWFRSLVTGLHDTGSLVYVDSVLNHNSPRQTSASFQTAGGYPGFWLAPKSPPRSKKPLDNWGDFHAGTSSGYLQSENPSGPRYDLLRGDLVSLIDISHESNHQFIRHPVDPNNPANIPAGTTYNKPDPANARFYPDRNLSAFTFTNPGTPRDPGSSQFTFYPFNTTDPMQGDPTMENATGLLMRWTQWMLDDVGVDGFRLDAAKHAPTWFWDRFWDSVVYKRRVTPWGAHVTPLSFVESVDNNAFTYSNYIRRYDGFGNRDALDINGAGALRGLISASGFGSWQNVLNQHIDTADDGLNNGSIGINHVFSHDNGSAGNGGSRPPLPSMRSVGLVEHAYTLLRAGPPIVYHNARAITRPGGFWPREGVPMALGLDESTGQLDPAITCLVLLRTEVARGELNVLNATDPINPSLDDVLVFERRTARIVGGYSANVLVGLNDRYDAGVQVRSVRTSFAPGTRLHELTGNADDPQVDPTGVVPSLLVVDAAGRVTITIPNNQSQAGEHNRGYVVYAPALPTGSLSLTNTASMIPADQPSVPAFRRRLNSVPVITADTFEIQLTTTRTDPLDPNADDNAVFRIDQGFVDYNGNGAFDIGLQDPVAPGFEQFLTQNDPLFGSASPQGVYRQIIDATRLAEGYHYITVFAYRHRNPGEAPLVRQWRQAIYIDRQGPTAELLDPGPITQPWATFSVRTLDRTGFRVHLMVDLDPNANPLLAASQSNRALRQDRFDFRRSVTNLSHGFHALTMVVFEETANASITQLPDFFVDICEADLNKDGTLDIFDFLAFQNFFALQDPRADCDQSTGPGVFDIFDFLCFQTQFAAGCP
jgi:hypothetical protein